MRGHLLLKSPLRQLGLFLGLFCLLYIFTGVFSLIIYKASGIDIEHIEKVDWNNSHVIAITKIVQAFSSILLFILPVFLFARLTFTGNYLYFLGFRNAEKTNMYVLAVVGILLALPFVFWMGDLNQQIPLPEQLIKMEEQTSRQMAAFLKIRSSLDIVINVFIIAL
jgi:hypothetical protein